MNPAVIEVENLTKRYGDVEALRGVSFSVSEGEVFGLLGPNGAGKTSTVEILEGLRTPDSGRVSVCGLDPQRSGAEFNTKSARPCNPPPCPTRCACTKLWISSEVFIRGAGAPPNCSSVLASKKSATHSIRSSLGDRSSVWPWRWLL